MVLAFALRADQGTLVRLLLQNPAGSPVPAPPSDVRGNGEWRQEAKEDGIFRLTFVLGSN